MNQISFLDVQVDDDIVPANLHKNENFQQVLVVEGGDVGIQTDQSIDVHAQILRELDCFNEYMINSNHEYSNDMVMDPQSILVARFDKHQVTAMDLMQMNMRPSG